jgi:hypothetical protein
LGTWNPKIVVSTIASRKIPAAGACKRRISSMKPLRYGMLVLIISAAEGSEEEVAEGNAVRMALRSLLWAEGYRLRYFRSQHVVFEVVSSPY